MTNREKLLAEMTELTSEQLDRILFANMSECDRLQKILGDYQCEDCKAKCGGECPARDDEDCGEPRGLSTPAWLELPCTRTRLVEDWDKVLCRTAQGRRKA